MKKLLSLILVVLVLCAFAIPASASSGTVYESESNNSMSTADRTYDDRDNYGSIGYAGDEDWWVISFPKDGCGSFWLGNIPSGHDYDLRVYDSNGNLLAKSIRNGTSDEFATINAKRNENYYVKIYGYNTATTAKYLMRAKLYSWRDADTPLYEQEQYDSCGAANMRMVLANSAIYVSEATVRERARIITGEDRGYMNQWQLYEVLNWFLSSYSRVTRFNYYFVNDISEASYWSSIQKNVNNGDPIITLCEYEDSGYFGSSSGHFITIRSYSPDAQRKQVRVNDSTPGSSGIKGIPLADLRDYTLYPNGRCHFTAPAWS